MVKGNKRRADISRVELGAAVREYLQERQRRGIAPTTLASERSVLYRTLKAGSVEQFLADLDVSARSYNHYLAVCQRFVRWCHHTGRMRRDPLHEVDKRRTRRTLPRGLKPEDVTALLKVADPRERLMVLLGVQEGLRCKEIAGLQVEDVEDRVALIVGKGDDERYVPISDQTWAAWQSYVRWRSGPVLRSRVSDAGLTPMYVSQQLTLLFRRAGVKGSAHALRHTCAHAMLDAGAELRDVQEMLGHANLATTSRYTKRHQNPQRLRWVTNGRWY